MGRVVSAQPPAPAAWGTHVDIRQHVLRHILEQHVLHNVSAWGYSTLTAQHAVDACAYESEFLPGMIIPQYSS
jgi:hypothetical protein